MPYIHDVFQHRSPVALITGSGSPRVGREIAVLLAGLGCRLALHANHSIDEAEEAAGVIAQDFDTDVIVTHGSLDDETVAEKIVADTHGHFGRLDILVNSAAIWSPTKLEEISADEMRRYHDVNLMGSFMTARAAGLRMAEQETGGSIINIGDWATVRPYMDHAAYFPSKGAVEVMTRSLAVELASRNRKIRVNCIQPGPVMLADDVTDAHRNKIAASTLVGQVGTAHHVAHGVKFLCENDFVTGVCLPIDGGRSIYAPDGLQVGINTG
tara:strand:- start:492919 stop:493725 length:807 start_codon:yes stop_codon:yes gene_type:complete